MPPSYVLFKHPVQLDTLAMVRFLHARGTLAPPVCVVERCHPPWATELPAVQELPAGARHVGLAAVTAYLEARSGETDLLRCALAWQAAHPEYRVRG